VDVAVVAGARVTVVALPAAGASLAHAPGMDLRCKVFRGPHADELERAINDFLAEQLSDEGDVQLEEITQSEGPAGVTITLWYSLVDREDEEILDEYDMRHPPGEMA
jgi:hypothetical protein